MQFFYEDGQGRIVDENGVEPMDLVVDDKLFAIETISSRTQFLANKPPERPHNPVMRAVADDGGNCHCRCFLQTAIAPGAHAPCWQPWKLLGSCVCCQHYLILWLLIA